MNFQRDMREEDVAHLALDATVLEVAKDAAAVVTALLPPEPSVNPFVPDKVAAAQAVAMMRFRTYLDAAIAAWQLAALCALDMLRNQEQRPMEPDQQYLHLEECLAMIENAPLAELQAAATDWEQFPWPVGSGAELIRIGKEQAEMIRQSRTLEKHDGSMH
jgi:hypothetical protein